MGGGKEVRGEAGRYGGMEVGMPYHESSAAAAMLQNPMMQQMLQQMMSNPAMLDQMAGGDPAMRALRRIHRCARH